MKKILYIGLILCFWGCTPNDILVYQEARNSIQFDYTPEGMTLDYDFEFQGRNLEDWRNAYYYGDSLRTDTVKLAVCLLGFKEDRMRTFRLKAVPVKGQDSTRLADVEFESSYTFRENSLVDTVQFLIHRPAKRGRYTIGVTFDVSDATDFALGVEEKNIYRINLTDLYPKPENWRACEPYLGEYTEEKYAFYVTVLNQIYEWGYWESLQYPWGSDFLGFIPKLKEALKAYNDAHPNAPKDFSFPE